VFLPDHKKYNANTVSAGQAVGARSTDAQQLAKSGQRMKRVFKRRSQMHVAQVDVHVLAMV